MTYELRIDGPAEGKGRPRFSKGRVFSPRDRYGFTDKIQSTARAEHIEKIEGPVALSVYIHRAIRPIGICSSKISIQVRIYLSEIFV